MKNPYPTHTRHSRRFLFKIAERIGARFVVAFFLLALLVPLLSAETQVSIHVSDNLATIGDRIALKFIIKTTSDIDGIKLKTGEKAFEILEQKPTQKRLQQDYTVLEKQVDVAFFKTGDFNIGPFEVELLKGEKVLETRETNSVPVTVKTVLAKDDTDIKALKSPVIIEGDPFYILKYALLALLIIGLVLFFIYWLKKRKKVTVPEEIQLTPLEELEARIRELAGGQLLEKGKAKQLFLQLTSILKTFLHRNYNFNAEDLTTYETNYKMKDIEKDILILNDFHFLFETSDLVKFAKFIPDNRVMEEVWKKTGELIMVYKDRLEALLREEELRKDSEGQAPSVEAPAAQSQIEAPAEPVQTVRSPYAPPGSPEHLPQQEEQR